MGGALVGSSVHGGSAFSHHYGSGSNGYARAEVAVGLRSRRAELGVGLGCSSPSSCGLSVDVCGALIHSCFGTRGGRSDGDDGAWSVDGDPVSKSLRRTRRARSYTKGVGLRDFLRIFNPLRGEIRRPFPRRADPRKLHMPLALGVQVTNDHCPCAKVANIIFRTPSAQWGTSVFLHA